LSLVLPARDANAISTKYSRHFPLAPGRKVAFKVPPVKEKGEVTEEGGWILAVVKKVDKGNRCVSSSVLGTECLQLNVWGRYQVQDIEGEEGGAAL
jgi:hypothetical protein